MAYNISIFWNEFHLYGTFEDSNGKTDIDLKPNLSFHFDSLIFDDNNLSYKKVINYEEIDLSNVEIEEIITTANVLKHGILLNSKNRADTILKYVGTLNRTDIITEMVPDPYKLNSYVWINSTWISKPLFSNTVEGLKIATRVRMYTKENLVRESYLLRDEELSDNVQNLITEVKNVFPGELDTILPQEIGAVDPDGVEYLQRIVTTYYFEKFPDESQYSWVLDIVTAQGLTREAYPPFYSVKYLMGTLEKAAKIIKYGNLDAEHIIIPEGNVILGTGKYYGSTDPFISGLLDIYIEWRGFSQLEELSTYLGLPLPIVNTTKYHEVPAIGITYSNDVPLKLKFYDMPPRLI